MLDGTVVPDMLYDHQRIGPYREESKQLPQRSRQDIRVLT